MNSREIRKKFLGFFKNNGHEVVDSSPLIPAQDPTILFANAGMNQFKDIFLGKEKRSYDCATTSQKCVRAGGKHNDLENVGFSDRHLTFFEMLGNFSFGAFFKEEAIAFAWKFLTEDLGIPAEKLSITVHDSDDESEKIWIEKIGVPKSRITRMGDEDNFWQMGDVGPCGPCTEIFYDRGIEYEDKVVNGRDLARFPEIWNLVFMQYNRQPDGELKPLTQKGVDTGMGLERISMVMQNGKSVFDTDIFADLKIFLEKETGICYKDSSDEVQSAFNVLCDHVRSSSLIIADGGFPANDGRGYVLRKIIRRAALFAQKISKNGKSNLFAELVPIFIKNNSDIFPELKTNVKLIESTISDEVERFAENLDRGRKIFESFVSENRESGVKELSGSQTFRLYDTYGFPLELTNVLAAEEGFSVDSDGFEVEMEQQRSQSCKKESMACSVELPEDVKTKFVGYEKTSCKGVVNWVCQNDAGFTLVSTNESPFYVESGGQVSDEGFFNVGESRCSVLDVSKVVTSPGNFSILHKIERCQTISVGDSVELIVNENVRRNTAKNHTGTHLLQSALVAILGSHVKQAGSLVNKDFLRFDFSHHKAVSSEEIKQVEELVNSWVQQAVETDIENTTLEKAREKGAIAFFGEKYNPEDVRVVQVKEISTELCGGTHLKNIGEIGFFKIVAEEALGVGVRRVFALTGSKGIEAAQERFETVRSLGEEFSVQPNEVLQAVAKERERVASLRKEVKALKKELLKIQIPEWREQMETVGLVSFLSLTLEDADVDVMRNICNDLTGANANSFVFIISKDVDEDKVKFMACFGKEAVSKLDIKELATLLKELGLRGGGKETILQGGGVVSDLKAVKRAVREFSEKR
jgi:alanyl-tRNA synthetase